MRRVQAQHHEHVAMRVREAQLLLRRSLRLSPRHRPASRDQMTTAASSGAVSLWYTLVGICPQLRAATRPYRHCVVQAPERVFLFVLPSTFMRWTITTPTGITGFATVNSEAEKAYFRKWRERGYLVLEVTIHRPPREACLACEG